MFCKGRLLTFGGGIASLQFIMMYILSQSRTSQPPICNFMYIYRLLQCTIWIGVYFALAKIQHPRQSTLLGRCNREVIDILHGHPHLSVRAVIGNWCSNILSSIGLRRLERNSLLTQWGLPAFRALITFRLVHIISHRNQLRVAQIVGKLLTPGCCPRCSTRLYIDT